jgi:hypothetical protein
MSIKICTDYILVKNNSEWFAVAKTELTDSDYIYVEDIGEPVLRCGEEMWTIKSLAKIATEKITIAENFIIFHGKFFDLQKYLRETMSVFFADDEYIPKSIFDDIYVEYNELRNLSGKIDAEKYFTEPEVSQNDSFRTGWHSPSVWIEDRKLYTLSFSSPEKITIVNGENYYELTEEKIRQKLFMDENLREEYFDDVKSYSMGTLNFSSADSNELEYCIEPGHHHYIFRAGYIHSLFHGKNFPIIIGFNRKKLKTIKVFSNGKIAVDLHDENFADDPTLTSKYTDIIIKSTKEELIINKSGEIEIIKFDDINFMVKNFNKSYTIFLKTGTSLMAYPAIDISFHCANKKLRI